MEALFTAGKGGEWDDKNEQRDTTAPRAKATPNVVAMVAILFVTMPPPHCDNRLLLAEPNEPKSEPAPSTVIKITKHSIPTYTQFVYVVRKINLYEVLHIHILCFVDTSGFAMKCRTSCQFAFGNW